MIYRKQTIWLLLAAITMLGVYIFPIYQLNEFGTLSVGGGYLTGYIAMVAAALSIVLSGVTIFGYKNLKKQILFCWLNVILCFIIIGLLHFTIHQYKDGLMGQLAGHFGIGAFVPLLPIVLLIMASLGIRHDKKAIAAADRLR